MVIKLESNYLAFSIQQCETNYFEWFTEWKSLLIIKKHQFIERIVGNHIECELGGVSVAIAFPFLWWEIN